MAEPAGIVNDRGPEDDEAFSQIIAASSDDVAALARGVRDLIYSVLPATVEVVWPRQGSVGWGTGPKKFSEQFAYLMPHRHHVTLGFFHGGDLPDPEGLLPQEGGKQVGGKLSMRSVRIDSLDQLEPPALGALIEASTKTGVPPPRQSK